MTVSPTARPEQHNGKHEKTRLDPLAAGWGHRVIVRPIFMFVWSRERGRSLGRLPHALVQHCVKS